MTVSVIIAVRNREVLLAEALASVLGQSLLPDEIIVVDDASTDNSAEVAMRAHQRVRLICRTAAGGPAVARNDGVRAATGEVLIFLDSDDLLVAGMIERHRAWLTAHPQDDSLYGAQQIFREAPPANATMAALGAITPVFQPGTFSVRKAAFLRVGWLNAALPAGEWIDWFSRAQTGGLRLEPETSLCLFRRAHAGNLTKNLTATASGYHRLIAEHLQRRRSDRSTG